MKTCLDSAMRANNESLIKYLFYWLGELEFFVCMCVVHTIQKACVYCSESTSMVTNGFCHMTHFLTKEDLGGVS